jgi:hypothetical protein
MRRIFVTLATLAFLAIPMRADAAAATINVFPVPAVAGQQVSVVGHGFCGSGGCSSVTITIEAQTVASNIKVDSGGDFTASFAVTVVPGDHDVVATQHSGSGDQIASAHLIVLPSDKRSTPPPPTVKQTGSTGGQTNGPTAGRSDGQPNSPLAVAGDRGDSGSGSDGSAWWIVGMLAVLAAATAGGLLYRARRSQSSA